MDGAEVLGAKAPGAQLYLLNRCDNIWPGHSNSWCRSQCNANNTSNHVWPGHCYCKRWSHSHTYWFIDNVWNRRTKRRCRGKCNASYSKHNLCDRICNSPRKWSCKLNRTIHHRKRRITYSRRWRYSQPNRTKRNSESRLHFGLWRNRYRPNTELQRCYNNTDSEFFRRCNNKRKN